MAAGSRSNMESIGLSGNKQFQDICKWMTQGEPSKPKSLNQLPAAGGTKKVAKALPGRRPLNASVPNSGVDRPVSGKNIRSLDSQKSTSTGPHVPLNSESPWLTNLVERGTEFGLNFDVDETLVPAASDSDLQLKEPSQMSQEGHVTIGGFDFRTFEPESLLPSDNRQEVEDAFTTVFGDDSAKVVQDGHNKDLMVMQIDHNTEFVRPIGVAKKLPNAGRPGFVETDCSKKQTKGVSVLKSTASSQFDAGCVTKAVSSGSVQKRNATDSICPSKTADVTKIKGWRKKTFAKNDRSVLKTKKVTDTKESNRAPVEITYDDSFINSHDITIEDEGPNIDLEMYDNIDITPLMADTPLVKIKQEVEDEPIESTTIEVDYDYDPPPRVAQSSKSENRLLPHVQIKSEKKAPNIVVYNPPTNIPSCPSTSQSPSVSGTQLPPPRISLLPISKLLPSSCDTKSAQVPKLPYKPKTKAEYRQMLAQLEARELPKISPKVPKHGNVPKPPSGSLNGPQHKKTHTKTCAPRIFPALDVRYIYVWNEGHPIQIRGSKGVVCSTKNVAKPSKVNSVKSSLSSTNTSPSSKISESVKYQKPKKISIMQPHGVGSSPATATQKDAPKETITTFGLKLFPSTSHSLSPIAVHHLKLLRGDSAVSDVDWNDFCVSNVTKTENVVVPPRPVVLPVKMLSTAERWGNKRYEPAALPVYSSSYREALQPVADISLGDAKLVETVVRCASDLPAIDSEVETMLKEMVNCVVMSDVKYNEYDSDPDVKATAETTEISKPKALPQSPLPRLPKKKVYKTKTKASLLDSELKRLRVTFIVKDEFPSNSGDSGSVSVCNNEYCKLGCVCRSARNNSEQLHCRRNECMFECTCDFKPVQRNDLLSPDIVTKINASLQNLARKEKEFQQTVVCGGKDDLIVVEGCHSPTHGRRKREVKLPQRYRQDTLMSDKEFDNAMTIEAQSGVSPVATPKTSVQTLPVTKKTAGVEIYVPNHVRGQIRSPQYHDPNCYKFSARSNGKMIKIKQSHVVMFKAMGLENVMHFCLVHRQYDCICLKVDSGLSFISAGTSVAQKPEGYSRNVAVKRTWPLPPSHCARSCLPKINYAARNKDPAHTAALRFKLSMFRKKYSKESSLPGIGIEYDSFMDSPPVQPSSASVSVSELPASSILPEPTSTQVAGSINMGTAESSSLACRSEGASATGSLVTQPFDIVSETLSTFAVPTLPARSKSGVTSLSTVKKSSSAKPKFTDVEPDKNLLCYEALPADDDSAVNTGPSSKQRLKNVSVNRLVKWSVLQENFRHNEIQLWIKSTNSQKRLFITKDDTPPGDSYRNLREYIAESMNTIPPFIAQLLDTSSISDRFAIIKNIGSMTEVCDIKRLNNVVYQRSHAVYKVPLPKCGAPCRWFVINMDTNFEKLQCFGCVITYRQLKLLAQAATVQNKVNSILFTNNFAAKCKLETAFPLVFGTYAVPRLSKKVFLGPFNLRTTDPVRLYAKGPQILCRSGEAVSKVDSFVELKNGVKDDVCWLFTESYSKALANRGLKRKTSPAEANSEIEPMTSNTGLSSLKYKFPKRQDNPNVGEFNVTVEEDSAKRIRTTLVIPSTQPIPAVQKCVSILQKPSTASPSPIVEDIPGEKGVPVSQPVEPTSPRTHAIRVKFFPTIPSLGYLEGSFTAQGSYKLSLEGLTDSEVTFKTVDDVTKYIRSVLDEKMTIVPYDLALNWVPRRFEKHVPKCIPFDPIILNGKHMLTEKGVSTRTVMLPPPPLKSSHRIDILRALSELSRVLGVDKKLSAHSVVVLAAQEASSATVRERQLCEEKVALRNQYLALIKRFDEERALVQTPELKRHLDETLREIIVARVDKARQTVIEINSDSELEDCYSEDDSLFDEDDKKEVIDLTSFEDSSLLIGSFANKMRAHRSVVPSADPASTRMFHGQGFKRPTSADPPYRKRKRCKVETATTDVQVPLLDITDEHEVEMGECTAVVATPSRWKTVEPEQFRVLKGRKLEPPSGVSRAIDIVPHAMRGPGIPFRMVVGGKGNAYCLQRGQSADSLMPPQTSFGGHNPNVEANTKTARQTLQDTSSGEQMTTLLSPRASIKPKNIGLPPLSPTTTKTVALNETSTSDSSSICVLPPFDSSNNAAVETITSAGQSSMSLLSRPLPKLKIVSKLLSVNESELTDMANDPVSNNFLQTQSSAPTSGNQSPQQPTTAGHVTTATLQSPQQPTKYSSRIMIKDPLQSTSTIHKLPMMSPQQLKNVSCRVAFRATSQPTIGRPRMVVRAQQQSTAHDPRWTVRALPQADGSTPNLTFRLAPQATAVGASPGQPARGAPRLRTTISPQGTIQMLQPPVYPIRTPPFRATPVVASNQTANVPMTFTAETRIVRLSAQPPGAVRLPSPLAATDQNNLRPRGNSMLVATSLPAIAPRQSSPTATAVSTGGANPSLPPPLLVRVIRPAFSPNLMRPRLLRPGGVTLSPPMAGAVRPRARMLTGGGQVQIARSIVPTVSSPALRLAPPVSPAQPPA